MAWKIYTTVLAALIIWGYSIAVIEGPTAMQAIDIPVTVFALVGLIGYAFKIPILNKQSWRAALPVVVLWDLFVNLSDISFSEPSNDATLATIVFLGILAPQWIALFLYGFRSERLWRENYLDIPLMTRCLIGKIIWVARWIPPIIFVTIAWSLIRLVRNRLSTHPEWQDLAKRLGLKYHQYSYIYPGTLNGKIGKYEVDINPATGEIEVEVPDLNRKWRQIVIRTSNPEGPPPPDMVEFRTPSGRFNWLFNTRYASSEAAEWLTNEREIADAFADFYERFLWSTFKLEYAYDDFSWESSHGGITRQIPVRLVEDIVNQLISIGDVLQAAQRSAKSQVVEAKKGDAGEPRKRLKESSEPSAGTYWVCVSCEALNPGHYSFCGGCGCARKS